MSNSTVFKHTFTIGDEVYHKTPESPKGLIVDIIFSKVNGLQYKVCFDHATDDLYREHELTFDKRF